MEEMVAKASDNLPSHCQDLNLAKGSTFLSVKVAASTVKQLLHCATCLVKMGLGYDTVSTVQFGNIALLYGTRETGDNVERIFLNEGVHDVPYIISAKGFKKRTIVIKGLYLENAEIKATATQKSYGESTSLNVVYYEKLEKDIEMLLVQLPTTSESSLKEGISVHAQKLVQVEECTIAMTLRSNAEVVEVIKPKYIQRVIGTLRTRRLWICFLIFYGFQVLIVSPWVFLPIEWMLVLPVWLLCYLLLDSIIGLWSYKITIRCLELMMRFWMHANEKLSITVNVEDSSANKELKDKDDKQNLAIIENVQNSSASKELKDRDIPTSSNKDDNKNLAIIENVQNFSASKELKNTDIPISSRTRMEDFLRLLHGSDSDENDDDTASINYSMSGHKETDGTSLMPF